VENLALTLIHSCRLHSSHTVSKQDFAYQCKPFKGQYWNNNKGTGLPFTAVCRCQYLALFQNNLFTMAQQSLVGQVLIIKDSRSHSDTWQSVGLLCKSDQPDAESSTWQHTTLKRDTLMSPVGFEPTISVADPRLRPRSNWNRTKIPL